MARVTFLRPLPVAVGARTKGTTVLGVAVVLALLLVASLLGGATPASPSSARSALSGPPTVATGLGPSPAVRATPATSGCSALAADWAARNAPVPAPAVSPSLQSPCVLSHDEPGLYLISNASGSAAQLEFTITLPPNGTIPGSAYDSFWVGMWVGGVPCSYGGESYLRVELLPPYASQDGVNGSPFWTVRAPVWDLVPAGSCDEQCSNDTAFFTLTGRSYCEDDAVLTGIGALNASGAGTFAPSDTLTLSFSGVAGGPAPLAVFLNDTTDAARDLAWNYSGAKTFVNGVFVNATVSGDSITPLYENASLTDTGWTDGLGIGFGSEDCPLPTAGPSFPSACNSYSGALSNVAPSPQVVHVASWNRISHGYTNLYPYVETASSSGACSGGAGVAPCSDFTSYGGSGSYPTFAVTAEGGGAWFSVGAARGSDVATFGGLANEFPANGTPSGLEDPTTVSDLRTTVTSSTVTITSRVTDPNGVRNVYVTAWWCGQNTTRVVNTTQAALVLVPPNSFLDGNYTDIFPTNSWRGNFNYWVDATSTTGLATAPAYGNVTLTSGTGNCGTTAPPPPTLVASSIQPTGGGYALNWTELAGQGVTHYAVLAAPAGGGGTSTFPVGNVTSTRIGGLLGNVSYDVQVIAFNAAGLSSSSSSAVALATLYPLLALPPQDVVVGTWVNATQVGITANVTGGLPPFQMVFSFGDGTSTTVFTTSGDASVIHLYSDNYSGVARVVIQTTDSAGDATVAPLLFFPVQATPLGTPATLSVGDGFAHFAWTAPPSPTPILSYTTYWTTNASLAPFLAEAWPSNVSVPQVHVVTVASIVTQWNLPLPAGTLVYGQVVATNKYGDGLLPAQATLGAEPYLEAVVADFTGGPLTGALLGSAPFTDSFSATFTTGTGNVLENATYHFSDGTLAYAALSGTDGTYFANASHTFVSPGAKTVYLYATDSLSELLLLTLDVAVTPGPDPVVSVTVAPTPVFVNTTVGFTASVSGGSGHYAENWSYGDGGTGTGLAVTYSYPNATTYLAELVVTDTLWDGVTTVTVPVAVLPIPTVQIAATASSAFGTYRLSAVVLGGYGNFSYTWLFDDGTQGNGASVTHAFKVGSYLVTLEAKDDFGHAATATVAIVVGYNTTGTGSGTTGYAPIVVYGLLAALLGVAFLAAIFAARSRRPPTEPAEDDSTGLAPLEPVAYVEEEPAKGPRS